jgi:hypothetical protein
MKCYRLTDILIWDADITICYQTLEDWEQEYHEWDCEDGVKKFFPTWEEFKNSGLVEEEEE